MWCDGPADVFVWVRPRKNPAAGGNAPRYLVQTLTATVSLTEARVDVSHAAEGGSTWLPYFTVTFAPQFFLPKTFLYFLTYFLFSFLLPTLTFTVLSFLAPLKVVDDGMEDPEELDDDEVFGL